MTSVELRKRFLAFFAAPSRTHTIVASDGLIPAGDPTVLFTSAGMNQFKDDFTGRRAELKRAASCQKCLRTGDLDQIGKMPFHHSFFEMLGNFSFGDYFKADAIRWAWEFLTGTLDYGGTPSPDRRALCLNLPAAKLWISVYQEDEEAMSLWRALGVPAERLRAFGQADNFWPANAPANGPNGPCGPCSEIYFDPDGAVQSPRSVEVWNLVFTQFDRQSDGSLKPLPRKGIDTGMGLERLAAVMQGVETSYDTDVFRHVISALRPNRKGRAKPAGGEQEFAVRAIADHVRALTFLIAEGVLPSNESRGYVLRMLIRRAYRLRLLLSGAPAARAGASEGNLLGALVEQAIADTAGSPYEAELRTKQAHLLRVVQEEERQFSRTLEAGTEKLAALFDRVRKAGRSTVPGDDAFRLYDTYGFPLELTMDIAREQGLEVDRAGFETAMNAQQARSRAHSQFSGGVFVTEGLRVRERLGKLPDRETHFIGYELLQADARVAGLWDGAAWIERAREGQDVGLVLDRSPFYGESGGQVGDAGRIEGPRGSAEVRITGWADDVLIHQATVRQGTLSVQEPVRAQVDAERRLRIARSHTATHLLHWALREVLGPQTAQAGSLVDADRVRFDFSALGGLHEEQRLQVEALVNRRVRHADAVLTEQMSLAQAKQAGALAFFGDTYGSRVRVVRIGDYSQELCGGTHLSHTGFVGAFTVVAESSIAAGTRRIEALVGDAAASRQQEDSRLLREAARRLGRPAQGLLPGLEELLEQVKRLERERKSLRLDMARVEAKRLVAEGKQINGIAFVAATLKQADQETLAAMADALKASLGQEGIVVLASGEAGRAAIVIAVTPQVAKRVHAGALLKAVAPLIQGSGGGRPEFAQGGGKEPSRLPAALAKAEELVREALQR